MENVKIWKYANFQGKCENIKICKLSGEMQKYFFNMRISREICGLFFPLSSFSSALPSPSPPFSGQVSLQIWEWFCCCSKAWEWNVDEERFSNHPKSKLSPMPRQSVIQQALQLHRVIIRNSKISLMPLRSDLLHTCHKKTNFRTLLLGLFPHSENCTPFARWYPWLIVQLAFVGWLFG